MVTLDCVLHTGQLEHRVDSRGIIDIIRGERAMEECRNLSLSCGHMSDAILATEHLYLDICEFTWSACADAVGNDG